MRIKCTSVEFDDLTTVVVHRVRGVPIHGMEDAIRRMETDNMETFVVPENFRAMFETDDRYIVAMWLLFCLSPSRPTPDVDGRFDLGDIGAAPEKDWTRFSGTAASIPTTLIPYFASHFFLSRGASDPRVEGTSIS